MIWGYPHFRKHGIYTWFFELCHGWEYTHRHGFTHVKIILPYLVKFCYTGPFSLQELSQGCLECFQHGGGFVDVQCRKALLLTPVHDAERMSAAESSSMHHVSTWMPAQTAQSTSGTTWNHVEPRGTMWNHVEPCGTMWNHVEPGGHGLPVPTLLTFSAHLIYLQYNTSRYKW